MGPPFFFIICLAREKVFRNRLYRFFSRAALGSDIGLGESFMFDEWDTDDIAAVIGFFIRNRPALADGNFRSPYPGRPWKGCGI